jgi:phage shock protein A
MKYNHIAGALKWAETPDSQEGLFLQPEEASSIDAALGANTQAVKDLTDTAATLAGETATKITALQDEVAAAKTSATEASDKLAAANTRITELEGEVATLQAEDGKEETKPEATPSDKFVNTGKAAMDFDFQKELLTKL